MINDYYADTLTRDTEGNLVKLCDSCAAQHAAFVQFASPLEEGATQRCERCGSSGCYPLALTPQRAQLEQHYRDTCAARDGVATELSAKLNQIHEQRATLTY